MGSRGREASFDQRPEEKRREEGKAAGRPEERRR